MICFEIRKRLSPFSLKYLRYQVVAFGYLINPSLHLNSIDVRFNFQNMLLRDNVVCDPKHSPSTINPESGIVLPVSGEEAGLLLPSSW